MPNGTIIYRGSTGRDQGRIVRIPVRDCPAPQEAVGGLTATFQQFDDSAAVVWEPDHRGRK